MTFTVKEQEVLEQVAIEADEVFDYIRKGIPQTKYVMKVPIGVLLNGPYEHLVGYWMMSHSTDLRYEPLNKCFNDSWDKCQQVEVTTLEWRECTK